MSIFKSDKQITLRERLTRLAKRVRLTKDALYANLLRLIFICYEEKIESFGGSGEAAGTQPARRLPFTDFYLILCQL